MLHKRELLWSLIKNDFKQRYLVNYLGVGWAFIQPAITILIFWFVFEVGFKAQPIDDFPFILWLIAGMIPWFFFADGLNSASTSILDNSYLVNKVAFRVSMLPIVKIASAVCVHLFFVSFMVSIYLFYGVRFSAYWLQIPYYTFAASVLLVGLSWITSSIIIFVRDVGQLIVMLVQFGFWLTPIFWSLNMIPDQYHGVIELNPLVYIVDGYRNSLIYNVWFWEDVSMTVYFWTITIVIFGVGVFTFKKLRPHFADVL